MANINCQDIRSYSQSGLTAMYETVGNYNLFMICDTPNTGAFRPLPDGYAFRLCARGELDLWMRTAVDEPYVGMVADFYRAVYAKHEDEFFRRCTFACGSDGKPVACCFIWRSYGQVDTVAWFRVLPAQEGRGIGRALLGHVLKDARSPVYLHTQPTSICAIKLYSDFGFKLITNPVVGHRRNNLAESLPYMQKVMPEAAYAGLRFIQIDDTLHNAALSSEPAEF